MNYKRLVASFLMGATFVSGFGAPVLGIDFGALDVSASVINYADASSNVDVSGIKAFVTRLYQVCLNRNPEEDGLNGWTNQLINRQATGCSVAYGFIFSPEFIGKNHSNEDFVNYMYDAFFGREADEGGFNYWVDLLNQGASKEFVFCGFANSQEFSNLCNSYGVVRGFHIEGYDFNQVGKVNLFVDRLYRIVLNRECDDDGMGGWTLKLLSHEQTGCDVAYGFVFSPEFLNRHTCDDCYVEILYNAFLGRSSDEGGKASWVGKLTEGASREEVFNGFAGSLEFAGICADYGIEAGSLGSGAGVTHAEGTCTICGQGNIGATPTTAPSSAPTSNSTSNPSTNSTPTSNPTTNQGVTNTPTSAPSGNGATTTPTPTPTVPASQLNSKDVVMKNEYYDFDALPKDTSSLDGYVEIQHDGEFEWDSYYFEKGQMLMGWVNIYVEVNGERYLYGKLYCDLNTGLAYKDGWHVIDGINYYFDKTGWLAIGVCEINNDLYCFNENGLMQYGLHDNHYFDLETGKAIKGWKTVDGKTYYFELNYKHKYDMVIGWFEKDNKHYYFDDSGVLQSDGWFTVDGKRYYAGNDGALMLGINDIDGEIYYLSLDGLQTGFVSQKYYFDPNTKTAVKGLQTIDNKLYYFNDSGIMQNGIVNVNGTLYYVDHLGTVRNGRYSIDGNKTYFICVNNIVQTGVIKYNNNIYIANSSGTLQSGWQTVNGDKYYIPGGSSYEAYTGLNVIGGTVYIFDTNTAKLCKGWTTQNGTRYYCNDNGVPVTGVQTIGGRKYYFDNNGEQKTGLITIGGSTYYFNDDMKYGWISLGNYMYYANTSTGALYKNSLQQINGKTYYFSSSGFLLTGEQQINSSYYFFGNDGAMLTGWQYVRSGYHYYNSDGRRQGPGWFTIGSTYYYLDSNSYRLTGWIQGNDGYWYYCDEDKAGAMITNSWKYTDNSWFYFDSLGIMKDSGWYQVGADWYYFANYNDPKGFIHGAAYRNCWLSDGGYWYYFNNDCIMLANQSNVYIDGNYYSFDASGHML
ncbi:MAG: DUF4214 domain-containing protein [Clostridia bacterium]|nr:DUF4214 domain-containing protein [Clostridia bacterium]